MNYPKPAAQSILRWISTACFSCLFAASAQSQILITEIQSKQDFSGGEDFFELTNFGAASVDLTGWKFDDDGADPLSGADLGSVSIAPGESVVFVQDLDPTAFRSWWGISESIQVVSHNGPGLGKNDAVNIYDDADNLVTSLSYAAGGFTRSDDTPATGEHAGPSAGAGEDHFSLIWDPASSVGAPRYTFAVAGENGAFGATQGEDVGSPGFTEAGAAPIPLAPVFTSDPVAYGRTGFNLSISVVSIEAQDGNGDSLTITATSKPAWVTLTDNGDGTATFSSTGDLTSSEVGEHSIELLVTDDSPAALTGTQTLSLIIFRDDSPVMVNEYNAVRSDRWLDVDGLEASDKADSFFGRIEGNGGDWFELVVLGDGTAGSTVDMRGWVIKVSDNGEADRSIVLSQDSYWADVPAGTILTFIDRPDAGGFDTSTAINRVNELSTNGFAWTNIQLDDPFFIDQSASDLAGFSISHDDTLIRIEDALGETLYGPVGEPVPANFEDGLPTGLGVNSREIFKLEQDPLTSGLKPDPYFGLYQDGTSSTFGAPNEWSGGTETQDFSVFTTSAYTAPVFTSTPSREAHVGEPYSYVIGLDQTASLSIAQADGTALPAWLSLSGNTLSGTPGAGDAGFLDIRIEATAGGDTTPQIVRLTVYPSDPTVILNEYNAVPGSNFLGGGDAAADAEGNPPSVARDTHFGRVEGNGGDWFELVVVGDGGRGTVDMRGWAIEIRDEAVFPFEAESRIVLSQDAFWANVPAGTILTFSEDDSANGGLDTNLAMTDAFATDGYAWTHVWVGDSQMIDQAASSGFTVEAGEVSGIRISNDDTQFLIRDAADAWVFGPAGEGIAPRSGIADTEIFELEGEPRPTVKPTVQASDDPVTEGYDDGKRQSTFGSPNEWDGQTREQDFSPWQNDRPVFTSTPASEATEGAPYSYAISTTDSDPRSLTLVDGPAWLSLSDNGDGSGTLTGTPDASELGLASVVLSVSDGHLAQTQTFTLTVAEAAGGFTSFMSDLELSGDEADFDADPVGRGFSNGVLYATGGFLPEASESGSPTPQFQFTLRQAADDITVIVEWSDDLAGTWTELTPAAQVGSPSVDDPEAGFDTFTYAAPDNLTETPAQFFRLRFTLP